MPDDFKTITFRVDPATATSDGEVMQVIHYGDSLKLVFTNVYGIAPGSCAVGIFSKVAGTYTLLAGGTGFSFVSGRKDSIYCTLDLATVGLKALVDASPAGTPVITRLFLRDSVKTWLDQDLPVYPSPLAGTVQPSEPSDMYVTVAQLNDLALSLPAGTLTAAQREARLAALIDGLIALRPVT